MKGLSVKTRMTLAVSVLTALLLSLLAFSVQVFLGDQIKQLIFSQQLTLVSAIADQIDDKIHTAQTELVNAASILARERVTDPQRMRAFFSSRPDTLAVFSNGLFIFTPGGELIFGTRTDPALLNKDFSGRAYLVKTVHSRRPEISEPFTSVEADRHPIVEFTAPVFDGKGAVIAVLAGSLDLMKDNLLGNLARVKIGKTGYLFVVDGTGRLLMHPERERILTTVPTGANKLLDQALAGFEGSGETINSRGKAMITALHRLTSTGWILAGNLPQREAYQSLSKTKHFLFSTLLAFFLISVSTIWLIMRHLTAPLLSITAQIGELSSTNSPNCGVKIETDDEVGMLGEAFNRLYTEVEQRKGELQKQLEFSQMLIDTLPNPVFYKDADGRYLGCNRAFESWIGYSRDKIVGKSVFDIAPAELAAVYHEADLEVVRGKKFQAYESSVVYADGSRHEVVFFKAPFPAADGTYGGMIGTMLDITDRKKAELELAAQKEFAESLVRNSAVPTFVVDSSHRVVIWNRACETLTGITAFEVIGTDRLREIFFPDRRPLLADLIIDGKLDALGSYFERYTLSALVPEGVQAEGVFRDKEGRSHSVFVSAAPIRDRNGELLAVIETLEDISARKEAEEAHEKTTRQLQLILDAAGEGIYGVDKRGKVTFVNPAAAKMVGWSQQELLGSDPHALLHHTRSDGSPYPTADCPVYAAFRDGKPHHAPNELFWRKNGTSFSVELVSTPLVEAGDLVGAVVVFKDTTERRMAEEQLLKLSQAVMQSPVAIVITDLRGNIEFVNPMFTEITGYDSAEAIGLPPRMLKSEDTSPEVYETLWSTISSGGVWSGELHNRCKNGGHAWVHATISPIRNSSGVISHYMSFMENMAERKKLEEQLRQAQKMEAVGQLAGGIAHDFNNILTVIMGFGQLLYNSMPADHPKRPHMDQILAAADRAAELTKSLLAFSRKQVMMLQQIELNALANKHLTFLDRIIGEDVTLRTSFTPEPLLVLADPGQIEQVLMNLATNARDAMPAGGELHISTSVIRLDKEFYIQHGYGIPGDYALLTITDTGCGMSQEIADKIFEPFFTTKAPGRGTGLGLSIVYGIIKQHGGYITIDSQYGHGTTFRIYLPLVEAKAENEAAPQLAMPMGGSETILVVEDDPAVRLLAESVLRTFGYHVISAENGVDALDIFRVNREKIDLALVDLIMPKMNGKQLCENLKKECPKLKVLFQSGYTADLLHDKGILVDGVELIMKPVQPIVLARKIREMLDAD